MLHRTQVDEMIAEAKREPSGDVTAGSHIEVSGALDRAE